MIAPSGAEIPGWWPIAIPGLIMFARNLWEGHVYRRDRGPDEPAWPELKLIGNIVGLVYASLGLAWSVRRWVQEDD